MAKPLITAGPGNELESGIFPGVDKLSAPFWADGENIEFRQGGVVSSKGYQGLATLPGEVNEMAQAFHNGDQRLYAAVGNGVYMRSSLTGLSSLGSFPTQGFPQFETFGSFLLATNYADPPMYWKNTGSLVAIADLPFTTAKIFHRRDNHVIAFNTSNGQNAYEWSSASDVDDWEPLSSNSAGNNWLRDLDSEIICAVDIGSRVAVYSRETMGLIQFIGQPDVFAHTPAINGVGAVGARSVVQVGPRNIGLNRQGVFVTDGVSFDYVDEPAIHEFLMADVDFSLGEEIRGYHNEDLSSVIWFYTPLSGGRAGVGYNYKKGTFTKYRQSVEVALERQVFSTPVAGIGPLLAQLNVGHSANGATLTKWVRTKPMSAQDASFWKTWSHLKTVGAFQNATVKIGVVDNPNDEAITWIDEQTLAFENWFDRDSVFLILEFRAEGLDSRFQISQLQLHGVVTGMVSS